eukprot:6158744-Amphidinium_carterae.1
MEAVQRSEGCCEGIVAWSPLWTPLCDVWLWALTSPAYEHPMVCLAHTVTAQCRVTRPSELKPLPS